MMGKGDVHVLLLAKTELTELVLLLLLRWGLGEYSKCHEMGRCGRFVRVEKPCT